MSPKRAPKKNEDTVHLLHCARIALVFLAVSEELHPSESFVYSTQSSRHPQTSFCVGLAKCVLNDGAYGRAWWLQCKLRFPL